MTWCQLFLIYNLALMLYGRLHPYLALNSQCLTAWPLLLALLPQNRCWGLEGACGIVYTSQQFLSGGSFATQQTFGDVWRHF